MTTLCTDSLGFLIKSLRCLRSRSSCFFLWELFEVATDVSPVATFFAGNYKWEKKEKGAMELRRTCSIFTAPSFSRRRCRCKRRCPCCHFFRRKKTLSCWRTCRRLMQLRTVVREREINVNNSRKRQRINPRVCFPSALLERSNRIPDLSKRAAALVHPSIFVTRRQRSLVSSFIHCRPPSFSLTP